MELFFMAFVSYTLLISLLFPSFSLAEATSVVLSHRDNPVDDIDLVSFLNSKANQHDSIFAEAVELLGSMKLSPSCNRIAASKLVASCQSIGGRTDNMDSDMYVALEHTRSLYAARLALCELEGAGASTPLPCLSVALSSPQKKVIFGFSIKQKSQTQAADFTSKESLESCLRSLESRPQWWTSYSNSRQNALVICQASRIESEKEELLELHRSIVEGSIKLNNGLREALQTAAAESSQHRAFVNATEAMTVEILQEIENTQSRFKSIFEAIFHDTESRVNLMMAKIASALGSVQSETTMIEKGIRNASSEVGHLQQVLRIIYDETWARNEQMAMAYQQDVSAHNSLALSLQSKLQSILQNDMAKLGHNVETFDTVLELLSARAGLILQQETSISERLRNFESILEESQLKADDLQKAQRQHFETLEAQSQLQDILQINMKISLALLDRAASTAANLQTMIDEATASYKQSPALGGLFGSYSIWVALCLLGILRTQTIKVAAAILIIGMVHFTTTKTL